MSWQQRRPDTKSQRVPTHTPHCVPARKIKWATERETPQPSEPDTSSLDCSARWFRCHRRVVLGLDNVSTHDLHTHTRLSYAHLDYLAILTNLAIFEIPPPLTVRTALLRTSDALLCTLERCLTDACTVGASLNLIGQLLGNLFPRLAVDTPALQAFRRIHAVTRLVAPILPLANVPFAVAVLPHEPISYSPWSSLVGVKTACRIRM